MDAGTDRSSVCLVGGFVSGLVAAAGGTLSENLLLGMYSMVLLLICILDVLRCVCNIPSDHV